jgi:hypothetical protein
VRAACNGRHDPDDLACTGTRCARHWCRRRCSAACSMDNRARGRISALLVGVAKVVAANALGLAFLASEIPCMHMCSTDRACSQSTPPSTNAAHAV